VTPIPTLPTISEAKGPEQGGSSGGSSESGDARPERRRSRPAMENTPNSEDSKGGKYFLFSAILKEGSHCAPLTRNK